ncbi:MAG: hypothetical protein JWQ84_1507 [Mucilaginibacter sp.]|nr:hypothetical protein [Mucilaginibacter sp.]
MQVCAAFRKQKACRVADYQRHNFRVEVAITPSSPDELIKNKPDLQV